MKLFENIKQDWKENIIPSFQTRTTKAGSFSLISTALVLAILIVINILVGSLPGTWTSFDISSSKLYSVTSSTKVVLNSLTKDVTIYWICQAGEEDEVVEKLLANYDDLCTHVTVETKNPDVYPTFASAYTSDTVANNSLVVECGSKYRYIPYSDLYETASYYGVSYNTGFDAESEITSAIDYVVNEDFPHMYILTGHGETELSDSVAESITKENVETASLSLLTVDEIPEDCDMILINAPQSDISETEYEMLAEYIKDGGKIVVISGPQVSNSAIIKDLDNLESLLGDYDISVYDDFILEQNRSYYAFGYQYLLMPEVLSHDISDAIISENYYPILYLAKGLQTGSYQGDAEISVLLETSDTSYCDADGFDALSYEQAEDDISGPLAAAVAIEETNGGSLVWFSSAYMLDDTFNTYSSGANLNLFLNTVSYMVGDEETGSIRTKSLSYEYLTISDSDASTIKTIMIVLVPLFFVALGIFTVVRRKQKR